MFKGLKNLKGVKVNRKHKACAIVLSFMVVLCTFFVGSNLLKYSPVEAYSSGYFGLTLDANGGTIDGKSTYVYSKNFTYVRESRDDASTIHATITQRINKQPIRNGYKFLYYTSVRDDPNSTKYYINDTYTYYYHAVTTLASIYINIYAYWEPLGYNINFDIKGGTGTADSLIAVPVSEDKVLPAVTLTKTGYTFDGWDTNSAGTNVVYENGATVKGLASAGETVTLYAVWNPINYTVHFDKNAELAEGTVSDLPMTYDVSANLNANNYTRTGYEFAGWNTAANGSGTSYTDEKSVSNLTTTNGWTVTLYAQWTPITYKISFNENDDNAQGSMSVLDMTYDTSKNLTTNAFSKSGYTFAGWNTEANGSGSSYSNGQSVKNLTSTKNSTVTLYAQYRENTYKVVFNKNASNASGEMDNETFNYTENKALTENAFARLGYTFKEWNTSQDGTGISYSDKQNVEKLSSTDNGTINLYAQWTLDTYTISCDLNGGTSSQYFPMNYNVTSGTINLENPTRNGYTFTGWTGSNGDEPQKNLSILTGSAGNKSYEANWEIVSYTISYSLSGGTTTNPTNYTIETNTITLSDPTKEGYDFTGWTGEETTTPAKNLQIEIGSTGDKTFTAHWTPTVYTISCDFAGGSLSGSNPDGYTIETSAITLSNPTKEGYVFKGWTGTELEEKTMVVTIPSGSTGDRSYVANWEANSYTISYSLSGGTTTNPTNYTIETDTITLSDAVRVGYNFDGWTVEGTTTPAKNLQIEIGSIGNKTFTAHWTPTTYTISCDLNGGELAGSNPTSYTIESEPINLLNPERTGYTFKGWKDAEDNVTLNVTISTGSVGDRSYIAQWISDTDITYQVNHYKMNLDGTTYTLDDNSLEVGATDSTIIIDDLKKTYEGFTFEGGKAFTTSTSEGNSYDTTTTVLGDKSRVINMYYSRNKYKVELDKEEGIASVIGAGEYFFEAVVTLGASLNPTYQFVSWTDKIAGTVTSLIKDYVFNMPSNSVSLLAKAKLNDEVNFTISHYKQKQDKSGYELVETENKKEVGEKTILINGLSKTPEGYNFDGGKVETPTETKPTNFDTSATISLDGTTNINLYYSVKSSGGGGGGSSGGGGGASTPTTPKITPGKNITDKEEQKLTKEILDKIVIKDGKIISLPDADDIKREGYTFGGFFYDEEFTKPVKVGDKITSETEIFIKWIKNEDKPVVDAKVLTVQTDKPYIKGYNDGEFKPKRYITRAEFATVISCLFEEYDEANLSSYIEQDKKFKDVRTDFWYTPYVGFIIQNNVMTGYADKTFKPNSNITRAEVCKALSSIFLFEDRNVYNKFEKELKGKWYEESVTKLIKAGLIEGYEDGTFRGNNNMTRTELVILINRITGKTITEEELNTLPVPFKDIKRSNWFYKDILIATK